MHNPFVRVSVLAFAAMLAACGGGNERSLTGIVAYALVRRSSAEEGTLELVIRPEAHRITLGRDCYVLHDVDVVDIIKDVLAEYDGPVAFRISRRYRRRDYCAQYREDDWTYVSRIAVPAAIPSLVTGLRLAFGYSWRALIGSELIAASSGVYFMRKKDFSLYIKHLNQDCFLLLLLPLLHHQANRRTRAKKRPMTGIPASLAATPALAE